MSDNDTTLNDTDPMPVVNDTDPTPSGSILASIKQMLGITDEYTVFDNDIIIWINSAFSTLWQLGVGPKTAQFKISDKNAVWSDFISGSDPESIKTYVFLKTRLGFDPPQNSFLVDAIDKQIKELEWRLNVAIETP